MKKLIVKVMIILSIIFFLKVAVIDPDKPHTFEVTIPSLTDIVVFFDKIADAIEETIKDFEVVLKDN